MLRENYDPGGAESLSKVDKGELVIEQVWSAARWNPYEEQMNTQNARLRIILKALCCDV